MDRVGTEASLNPHMKQSGQLIDQPTNFPSEENPFIPRLALSLFEAPCLFASEWLPPQLV